MKPSIEQLKNRFTYHNPQAAKDPSAVLGAYAQIRAKGLEFAELITTICPDSDELNQALVCVDWAVMQANAAIARNQDEVSNGQA